MQADILYKAMGGAPPGELEKVAASGAAELAVAERVMMIGPATARPQAWECCARCSATLR